MLSIRRAALAGACLLLSPLASAATIYVDADLTSGAGDGSSWADAFRGPDGLQVALAAAAPGDRIFVAEGLYLPSLSGDRTASFALQSGVEVYGGFLGGETAPEQRPAADSAPSILSGDLAGNDGVGGLGDNSYHLVTTAGTDATAVLDGFRVIAGNANGGGGANSDRGAGILCTNGASPTIRACRFLDHRCTFGGAAGYVNTNATPTFEACTFEDGDGGSFGGAFDIAGGGGVKFDRCLFARNRASRAGALEIFATDGVRVRNCAFVDNLATGSGGGGAIWSGSGSSPRVLNSTLVGNRSTGQAAGGIRDAGSSNFIVVNSILWDNEGPGGAQGSANQASSTVKITYSIVEGGFTGNGNLAQDPLLEGLAAGDLTPSAASPSIDAGNTNALGQAFDLDLAGNARFVDDPNTADSGLGGPPVVDIGAIEFEPTTVVEIPGCFGNAMDMSLIEVIVAAGFSAVATPGGITDGLAVLYVGLPGVDVNGCGVPVGGLGEVLLSLAPFPLELATAPVVAGTAQFTLQAPNDPNLVGKQLAFQTLAFDALGATELSDLVLATVQP